MEKNSRPPKNDVYVEMAKEKHDIKMRILKLKEWKLKHECIQMGIGLPPEYKTSVVEDKVR